MSAAALRSIALASRGGFGAGSKRTLPTAVVVSRARLATGTRYGAAALFGNRRWASDSIGANSTAETQTQSKPQNEVKFTSEMYPELKRASGFKEISKEDVDYFKSFLAENSIIDGYSQDATDDIEPFNMDWMRKYKGHTKLVLKPKTTEDVSKILKYCNEKKLAVVPQGGNTGLVGGSVPVFDEIVLSLASMNKVRSFDPTSGIFVADAGVILEAADGYLAKQGHLFPLDLGAKGSCHIGGNVATNAGGLRLLRYGSLHGTVLGLEVVLPDGTIFNDLSQLRKNNTGFDLKQLFIGSEGTIGIITAISILCPRRPSATNVAYLGLESYEHVLQAFVKAKEQLGEILSAFEMMDGRTQNMIHETTQKKRPLENEHPFHVLIETSGSNKDHDDEKLAGLIEHLMETEVVTDGVLAENETQIQNLWSWRETIPEATKHWGGIYRYDVSIPLPQLYDLVNDTREHLTKKGLIGGPDAPVVDAVGFGHMGDGNLHLNVATRGYFKEVEQALEPFVFEWIQKVNGSISAEHGLGLAKREFIGYSRDETSVRLMRDIKKLYDPNGIMNPYKYVDE